MTPEIGLPQTCSREVSSFLLSCLHDAAADIRSADVDCEYRVVSFEDPGRCKVHAADQPGLVRVKTDWTNIDLVSFCPENDFRAGYCKFAEPALPKTSANHNVLGIRPSLELQKPADNTCELLRKLFQRAVQDCGRLDIIADKDLIELLL